MRKQFFFLVVLCLCMIMVTPVWGEEALRKPSLLTAEALSSSSIRLTWSDNSMNEAGFKIEISSWTDSDYRQIGLVMTGHNSFLVEGLSPSKHYSFRVKAYTASSESDYSNVASATTSPLPPQTIMRFYIDSPYYYIKAPSSSTSTLHNIDTPPTLIENRTMLPIKYIAQHKIGRASCRERV